MVPETTTAEVVTEEVASAKPEMSREELEVAGRDEISRFLGNPSGQAHDMARDLNDEELTAVVAAGTNRHTARDAIKGVFTSAYDRKRKEHEATAKADQDRLNTRAAAMRALFANGWTDQEAEELVAILSTGEQKIIAAISGEVEADEVILATIDRARSRAAAAADASVSTDPDPPAE